MNGTREGLKGDREMQIRFATKEDSKALLKIYSQYINTPYTFEYNLPDEKEFADRIEKIGSKYPFMVCATDEGEVVGYAFAFRQLMRDAYQWDADVAVYFDDAYTSQGLGKLLYTVIIEILKLQGVVTVSERVSIPNEKSVKLLESLGFTKIGEAPKAGYKCGHWIDEALYERNILPHSEKPPKITPIKDVPKKDIDDVIEGLHGLMIFGNEFYL